jgi:hypothetical protein
MIWSSGLLVASYIREVAMIEKVKSGYQVDSSKGKNLGGPYKTLDGVKKRLPQVEFFEQKSV